MIVQIAIRYQFLGTYFGHFAARGSLYCYFEATIDKINIWIDYRL